MSHNGNEYTHNSLPFGSLQFGPVHGQFSFSPPNPSGTTRTFAGRVTTTIHGMETTMPTSTYLNHTPENRFALIYPPGLVLEAGYHEPGRPAPLPVPADAPPPPPPVDIKTGKPLTAPVPTPPPPPPPPPSVSSAHSAPAKSDGGGQKCSSCSHARVPAEEVKRKYPFKIPIEASE